MTAWAYCLAYNEAPLIAYWVRHHLQFCERVIVYADDDCDDGTQEIATREGAEVRPWSNNGLHLDDNSFVDFANSQYHEADGKVDWVVWLDADEFLYHTNPKQYLSELTEAGVNMPFNPQYTMSSSRLPVHSGQIYDDPEFRKGFLVPGDAKITIFNPNQIRVLWDVGKHAAGIVGWLARDNNSPEKFKLLHYRWLGEAYLRERDAKNYARLSSLNLRNGLGYHVYPGFVGPYHEGWPGPKPKDATIVI